MLFRSPFPIKGTTHDLILWLGQGISKMSLEGILMPESKKVMKQNTQILNIENPKDATRKLLELINEFGKVAGYKINE